MKESISITSIFQIVILFILLFTAIMILTINNSNAFATKNEIINIINFNNGRYLDEHNKEKLDDDIIDAIKTASYRNTGKCPSDGYVGYRKDGHVVSSNEKASICIKEVNVTEGYDNYLSDLIPDDLYAKDDLIPGKYYVVLVFYQLDLPVLGQIFDMKTKGETRVIYDW